jgi:hypothetical protein
MATRSLMADGYMIPMADGYMIPMADGYMIPDG